MLTVDSQPPPLFRKASLFRRFTRKERRLEISRPIIDEPQTVQPPQTPHLPPTLHSPKLQRRATDRVAVSPSSLPPPNTTPASKPRPFIAHIRVDSGSFPDLPISQQFRRPHPPSPARSAHSSRPSTDTTSSTHSRVQRTAHTTSPFPHNTRIGPWDLFLPPSQVHALYAGFYPDNMADQWFVFSEGPDVNGKLKVHFHRAWTGLKVAELFVVMDLKGEGAGKIVGVKWNGSEQTSRMVEEEAKRTVRGACRESLGIELEGEEF